MKELILQTALKLAMTKGYSHLTKLDVAKAAGVAGGSIHYHFKTMRRLQLAVLREAVKSKQLPIVAQGICANESIALNAPFELRQAALRSLA